MRSHNNRGMELMNLMLREKMDEESLPLSALTEEEAFRSILRHLIEDMNLDFRTFKNLDKKLGTNFTARSMKVTATKTKTKDLEKKIDVATELLTKYGDGYPGIKLVIETATNTVLKYISRSKTASRKILEDIESEAGRQKLFLLSAYSLADASITLYGEFQQSRSMELFAKTRRANEAEMRKVFSRNSWEDAVEIFKRTMHEKKSVYISSGALDELADEKIIYSLVKKSDLLEKIWLMSDEIRENVTGQVRLSMK